MANADELLAEWAECTPAYEYAGYWCCKHCELTSYVYCKGDGDPMKNPAQHDVGCIWRRAKEYLKDTVVGEK